MITSGSRLLEAERVIRVCGSGSGVGWDIPENREYLRTVPSPAGGSRDVLRRREYEAIGTRWLSRREYVLVG